jgi:outer membrane protein assembly factor BamB
MGYNAATPIVDGQTVIVCGSGRGAKALKIEKDGDAFKATELWTNPDNAVQFNTPVLKNGLLFGVSQNGKFFCINAKSGQTAWTDPTGQRTRRGFGSVVDAGSVLLALTESSQLTVFQPSDKEYTEVASFKVADKQTYAYPVPAGKGIYIKDQDSLTLYTVD